MKAVPIFVVGHPRSGTTWIYDILVSHPRVAGALETWMFTEQWGLGALFHERHWSASRHERQYEAVGQTLGLGQLVSRDELISTVRDLSDRWLSRAISDEDFVVEKSPNHLSRLNLISEIYPEAKFIHVIRDGRDVMVSMRAGGGWAGFTPPWLADTWSTARRWRAAVRKCREQGRALGDRYLEVRYEEIRADTVTGVERLLGFCGIDPESAPRIAEQTSMERHKTGETLFRRAGRVGDWRARLSLRDRLAYERGAGDQLRSEGYEGGKLWWLLPRRHR